VETAARVQYLEEQKIGLDSDIARLAGEYRSLSDGFAKDRVSVTRLLATLERLQLDVPPAMALHPDDALAAARGAMLIGASLPLLYGRAAALAERIKLIRTTHAELISRRDESERNAANLNSARSELNQLLASKVIAAEAAESQYSDLKAKLDAIASHAGDLESLLTKVAALKGQPMSQGVVVITAAQTQRAQAPRRGALFRPVVGSVLSPQQGINPGPGMMFETAPGAAVVSPGDGKVLFSGPYHKYGHVLILETTLGYDVVLAGLDRVDVRPADQVLAGEPVGLMPKNDPVERLYFELRQNGRGIDPSPWLSFEPRKAKKT
jgi:septal ring factor EnvC (AmiA/AmiB activator)